MYPGAALLGVLGCALIASGLSVSGHGPGNVDSVTKRCASCEKHNTGELRVECYSELCCRAIGLDPDMPLVRNPTQLRFVGHVLILQFLYYPNDPIPETNNLQITAFPGNLNKTQFVYDNDDHYFFANTTPTSSLYFDDDKLSLDHQAAPFFIDQTGLVSYQEYDGSYKRDDFYTDFYAAPQDTVMQNKRDYCQPESVIYEVAFY